MSEAILQESNSDDYLIPREEFTFISDPGSLEDVVIYEMVIEYQANRDYKDDDIVEIEREPQEQNRRDAFTLPQQNQGSQPEALTTSQIPIDHEEKISAQDPFDQPQDQIEDWLTILTRGRQQQKWRREGIHEEDLAIMIADRTDLTPTNRELVSYIYGYYEKDDPTIPTSKY